MGKSNLKKKGVILFMVLAIFLIVAILVNGILNFVLSHYQQTFHRTRRIKAYYAAMAGINLAMDKLRRGDWQFPPPTRTYMLCGPNATTNCCGATGCGISPNITDSNIPYDITITISGTATNSTIIATVDYTTS